jgi:hypothetical protein
VILVGTLLKGENRRGTRFLNWGLVEKEDEEVDERVA